MSETSSTEGSVEQATGERRSRQIGEKRELEQAPLMLRKAAMILLIGALFPFFSAIKYATAVKTMGAGGEADPFPWTVFLGAKALALIGCWLFHQGYMATHGGKAKNDFIDKLAKSHHMAMPALAGVFWIGALVFIFMSNGAMIDAIDGSGAKEVFKFGCASEVATLILAGATFSHIFGYEHGGKFNPIFPLMFLGPGLAGLLNVFGAMGALGGSTAMYALMGLVGSLIVAAGGGMAMHTMYASMKQAKIEGEIKREALREERKRQREAQRAARKKEEDDE
ncbi:MAG: hypothetical protein GY711_05780 [bacterium]|nr:hypothetical protein [bacterium]